MVRTKRYTKVTSEVFDKLNAFIFILFPKLDMTILTGCDNKICPRRKLNSFLLELKLGKT